MAGNAISAGAAKGADVETDVENDEKETIYRAHINLRMPTPYAVKQFPITAQLRQDEDEKKQENRKAGRLVQEARISLGAQIEPKKENRLVIDKTDRVTLTSVAGHLGDNFTLIGADFSVTDGGRSTKIKLRFVKNGMEFEQPKPAEYPDGQRRQAYFHSHIREIWEEFLAWTKKMTVSIQVHENEARVMPGYSIVMIDATHATPVKELEPKKRLFVDGKGVCLGWV